MTYEDEYKVLLQKFESESNARRSIQLELENSTRNYEAQIVQLKSQSSETIKQKNLAEERVRILEASVADFKNQSSQTKTDYNSLKVE